MSGIDALVNRAAKTHRHVARWARRENIDAFRIYDRDIPEFPLAIDRYADWLHVQVYERRRTLPVEQLHATRDALAERFGIPRQQVILKERRRQRGLTQYERQEVSTPSFTVNERGLRFEVNLARYLDTGLFLDHRDTRQRVRRQATGKRVLNLFAYTGSFTVYAAAGGAERTVSVDMSRTYQAWNRRNLVRNGFDDPSKHHLVQTDVLAFVNRMHAARARFDLIVLDPPSFSNSKRTQQSFDVQRDHRALLASTIELLSPGGTLYFSCNRQGFKMDPAVAELACVQEITSQTIPDDFRGRPHRCWTLGAAT